MSTAPVFCAKCGEKLGANYACPTAECTYDNSATGRLKAATADLRALVVGDDDHSEDHVRPIEEVLSDFVRKRPKRKEVSAFDSDDYNCVVGVCARLDERLAAARANDRALRSFEVQLIERLPLWLVMAGYLPSADAIPYVRADLYRQAALLASNGRTRDDFFRTVVEQTRLRTPNEAALPAKIYKRVMAKLPNQSRERRRARSPRRPYQPRGGATASRSSSRSSASSSRGGSRTPRPSASKASSRGAQRTFCTRCGMNDVTDGHPGCRRDSPSTQRTTRSATRKQSSRSISTSGTRSRDG